jgi:hypothetical protein
MIQVLETGLACESGADARDRTADLLITNQPVLAVFSFESEPLGGLWEVSPNRFAVEQAFCGRLSSAHREWVFPQVALV